MIGIARRTLVQRLTDWASPGLANPPRAKSKTTAATCERSGALLRTPLHMPSSLTPAARSETAKVDSWHAP